MEGLTPDEKGKVTVSGMTGKSCPRTPVALAPCAMSGQTLDRFFFGAAQGPGTFITGEVGAHPCEQLAFLP